MKEREYHFKIHSISRFIIAISLILSTLSILMSNYLPKTENEIVSILQFAVIFLTSFYIANQAAMAKVKVVLSKEGITHIWIRKFLISRGNDIKIPWDIVNNYVFQKEKTFDSFIIHLTNKTRYKINRMNALPIKGDFKKLVEDFPKLSNEYKNELTSDTPTKKIEEGESFYFSKSFKRFFYFMSALFLVLLLTKIFNPDSATTWSTLGILWGSLLFCSSVLKKQKN